MFMRLLAQAGVVVAVVGLAPTAALAQCDDIATLLPWNGTAGEDFGFSVSVDGDFALVGAPTDNVSGLYSGSAYVYRNVAGEWLEHSHLVPDDGAAFANFGYSVSLDGDVAVIGAKGDSSVAGIAGAAYVYRFSGSSWIQEQKIHASDATYGDFFGEAVAVAGSTVVVGAYKSDVQGLNSGAAYVFEHDGAAWTETTQLLASDGSTGDFFGTTVAVAGDTVLVSATLQDAAGEDAGAVYVFQRDDAGWLESQKLVAPDAASHDAFGKSLSISGDVAVVGSHVNDNQNGSWAGAVYVFRSDAGLWQSEQKLTASDGYHYDQFGISVSVSGSTIIVGAGWDDDQGVDAGAAYVFFHDGSSWIENSKITSPDGTGGDLFGFSVDISGDTMVVGAYFDEASGSTNVFQGMSTGGVADCNGNGTADACDIAAGASQDENHNGVPDECEESPADINDDGAVDVLDLIELLAAWGVCEGPCPADLDGDGVVGVLDLVDLIFAWA